MKSAIFCVLACVLASASDEHWENFRPESVKQYGCSIQEVQLAVHGAASQSKFRFTAWATRDLPAPDDNWRKPIGLYPPTSKGRSEAMRDCNKWMSQAEKRLRAARK